jgi:protocatechuate 3,4-dioxygenase beta subunit
MAQAKAGAGELRLVLLGGAEVVVRLLEVPGDRPVEGARLMAMFGEKSSVGGREMSFAAGLTDGRGEALFRARPGNLQMLWFNHPERGNGMWSPMMPAEAGGNIRGPQDATVKRPRTELVFRIEQGLTITGRVTDPDGRPIPGARCRAMGNMGFGGSALTDSDGRYALPGQGTLVMLVVVTAPGWVQRAPEDVGNRPPPDERGEVAFDVVMDPAATVTGRVLGPDGQPLAGVRVKLSAAGSAAVFAAVGGAGSEAITNASGRYVLDRARPGKGTRVLARQSGYLDGRTDEFEVAAGAPATAPDLVLRRGSRLLVSVEDPDGAAVRGARVEVSVQRSPDAVVWDPTQAFRGFSDQVTGEEGRATIEDVPEGETTVTATADGFAGARRTVTVKREGGDGTTRLTLPLREAIALRGRVLDPDGKGVGEAMVAASGASGQEDPDAWVPTVSARTDEQGRFALEGLPARAGPVQLEVHAEGYQRVALTVQGPSAELEIRATPMSADAQRRLEEIQRELMGIYQRFAQAKDAGERDALTQRMVALQAEQRKLQGEPEGADTIQDDR